MPEACKELQFKIENFLAVDQVCPLRVRPREQEIIFFGLKERGVFQKKASTFTAIVPKPNSR